MALEPHARAALALRLLLWADDELIFAHRNSEWTGHAPILEEDIALANLAQDELGHATLWYGLYAALAGRDETYADELVYLRDAAGWRNVQMVELPKGDWAFTMLRHYLFDAYESLLLPQLVQSAHAPLAAAAQTMLREERYHLQHCEIWVKRLGLGSAESAQRMQAALDVLWPLAAQLFAPLPEDDALVAAGMLAKPVHVLSGDWHAGCAAHLKACGLKPPVQQSSSIGQISRSEHTPNLAVLLNELQRVARADPKAEW
jgi:ring-1,2-phenylacetyl-CoA epoxidase subunit PaaC